MSALQSQRAHTEFSVGAEGRFVIGTPDQAVATARGFQKRIHIYRVAGGCRTFVGYAMPDGRVVVPN